VPDPVPQADEVVLQLHYAGLNPADRYLAQRQYPLKPQLPHILGRDGLGTVVRLGSNVSDLAVGAQRIIMRSDVGGTRPGTFAEKVAVPVEDLAEVPAGWNDQEASGATLVYLTAYQALTMWGPLEPGGVVLITGASGGVGVAATQLASAMGYQVVGLSRSAEKSVRLRELGAAMTLNPEDAEWCKLLKKQIAPRRVALAVDNVGGKLLPEVIDTLGDLGKVSLVGRLAGSRAYALAEAWYIVRGMR
jgi:NADPH2:quinone reductase